VYVHKHSKTGEPLYLHKKLTYTKRSFLYYFTKDSKDAIDLPPFLEVVESSRSGYPFVRKKR